MKVGILGGGQLGRMLALAGYPLGLTFRCLDPAPDAPAGQLAELLVGDYGDASALARFAAGLDAVTYEFENVPVAAARRLAERLPLHPSVAALETAQDRLAEKTLFQRLDIPTAPFVAVDDRAGLDAAVARLGLPAVLKTRRFGYDGKGQVVLRVPGDTVAAWDVLGAQALILEPFVEFRREVSVLGVAGRDGEARFYPLVENTHRDGILRTSLAPAPGAAPGPQALAEAHATRILAELGYVGVLAIEFFEVEGRLLANEMAPRVHNSGHWTIEGAETSQFENHLRAVLGLPLGGTAARGTSLMLNLVGTVPDTAAVLAVPGAHLHLYGKEPRAGRKLGHITVRVDSAEELARARERLVAVDEI
ncbi:MAG: 5-(carboxyamino)imidazole ribonucleotide synthase [Candidatus Rokuibacteriota bacterium]